MNNIKTGNILWQIISYLFHPLFIPIYLTFYLIYCNPILFINNTHEQKISLLLNVLINLVFFQAFTVFLLKQLNFIKSIFLPTQKDRIIPLFSYTIYTFWTWAFVLMKNPANYPKIAVNMGLDFFIASSLALILNSFYKISLHMIGAGLFVALCIFCYIETSNSILYILFSLLVALSIFLSRKNCGSHTTFELYAGFMLGLTSMLIIQFWFK